MGKTKKPVAIVSKTKKKAVVKTKRLNSAQTLTKQLKVMKFVYGFYVKTHFSKKIKS
jgi:hypothetical protein